MTLPVTVTVTVLRAVATGVGAAFGFEGFAHLGHIQVHGAQHVGQHMVGFDLEVVWPQFDGHMAVAQVVGRAHQVEGRVVVVTMVGGRCRR